MIPQDTLNIIEQEAEKFICDWCSETFKSDIDLQAHLFNNNHCNPKPQKKMMAETIFTPSAWNKTPNQ